jgi:starch phosphorylase
MRGRYNPEATVQNDANLSRVIDLLEKGHFSQFEPGIFQPIIDSIRNPSDPWMVAADFGSYVEAQEQVAAAYRDRERWVRSSILNTACSGKFSTDRTMIEYSRDIWNLEKVAPPRM